MFLMGNLIKHLVSCYMEKHVCKVRGKYDAINKLSDLRYNSAHLSNQRKFGQAVSRAIGRAIESDGEDCKIIGLQIQNILCINPS